MSKKNTAHVLIAVIYVAIHDARRLIHVCCFSSLMLCLCCMLRESYTSRCDTITICMQQQRSCMLVLKAAQHKHTERESLAYYRQAVFENRHEGFTVCLFCISSMNDLLDSYAVWHYGTKNLHETQKRVFKMACSIQNIMQALIFIS